MTETDDRDVIRRVRERYPEVGPIDPAAAARIVDAIRREPRVERASPLAWWEKLRLLGWTAPAMAAVLLLAGGALGWTLRARWSSPVVPGQAPEELAHLSATGEVRLVQFVIEVPRASSVTVVGNFNDWDPHATPMRRQPGGAWVAAVPLPPGRHVYAFVVDGDRWVADPAAPLAPEDGFGIRNSVIVVGGAET